VITDKGPQFYAVDARAKGQGPGARGKKKGLGEFEKYLQACGVKHIVTHSGGDPASPDQW